LMPHVYCSIEGQLLFLFRSRIIDVARLSSVRVGTGGV